MRSNTRNLRKTALCMAMGLCLSSLTAPVLAQSVTGAVAGRAEAGAQITITNESTGLSRTVTVGADGTYRIAQLPPGDYTVTAGGAPVAVKVSLGGTTSLNLGAAGTVELDTVQVVGSRVVNRVDVYSTEKNNGPYPLHHALCALRIRRGAAAEESPADRVSIGGRPR